MQNLIVFLTDFKRREVLNLYRIFLDVCMSITPPKILLDLSKNFWIGSNKYMFYKCI